MIDKFDIFIEIFNKESESNHNKIYITVGQFASILEITNAIYRNYDENLDVKQNIDKHHNRIIVPMGDCGMNRL